MSQVTEIIKRYRNANKKRFGMARSLSTRCKHQGRIQSPGDAAGVASMGPAAHTPLLLWRIVKLHEQTTSVLAPQLQQLAPHLRVVSKRKIGKKLPYPAKR
jgi:hypothetical protein